MGSVAEELYKAFVRASGLVAGSGDVPNWASMSSEQREVWEAVAKIAASFYTDNRLVLMSDGPLEETVARAAVVIDTDGHVIKNRYGHVTREPVAAVRTTPLDDMLATLIVDLHSLARDGIHTNGHRLETLIEKTHALALVLDDTRRRVLKMEARRGS